MSGSASVHARVAKHAGLTFAGTLANNLLSYVFYALVSRALGVEAYGSFSSLLAIVFVASAPAAIAQLTVAKLSTQYADDPEGLAGLVRAVDRLALIIAAGATAVMALLAKPIADFLHLGDAWLVVIAALALGGLIALPFFRGVLQGTSSFSAFALSNVVEGASKAVFPPLMAVVAGLPGALAGAACAYAVPAAYTYVVGHPHRRGVAPPYSLRRAVGTTAGVALTVSCIYVMLFFDTILTKRYLDAHTAGLYGAVSLACRALYAVTSFIPVVLLPQAALTAQRGHTTRALFAQAVGLTLAICIPTCIGFALFPQLVMTAIAGRAFTSAAPMLEPYVLAMAALCVANVVATYNIARGRTAFVGPLAAVALGEIIAVVVRHRSAGDVLQTIGVGHTLAIVACATSLFGARAKASAPSSESTPASA